MFASDFQLAIALARVVGGTGEIDAASSQIPG
jgi:hypothetical protein